MSCYYRRKGSDIPNIRGPVNRVVRTPVAGAWRLPVMERRGCLDGLAAPAAIELFAVCRGKPSQRGKNCFYN
jgi:hypothetical protein